MKENLDSQSLYSPHQNTPEVGVSEHLLDVLFLGHHVAASQLMQMKMILTFTQMPDSRGRHTVIDPHFLDNDPNSRNHNPVKPNTIDIKKSRIVNKYTLSNPNEFFDYNSYYFYAKMALALDPKNFFVQEWITHLVQNADMVHRSIYVFKHVFNKYKLQDWHYPMAIGWLYYYCLKDYSSARKWLKKAKEMEHAPALVQSLITSSYAIEKRYIHAIEFTQKQIRESADFQTAEKLQKKLHWYQSLHLLSVCAKSFKEKVQRPLNHLDELIQQGFIKVIPDDPIGDGFKWNKYTQEVESINNPFTLVVERKPVAIDEINIDPKKRNLHLYGSNV